MGYGQLLCSHTQGLSTAASTAAVQWPVDKVPLTPLAGRAELTPMNIVDRLNRYIVGQDDAKRAVAIALRNRWRRQQLPSPFKDEIIPKNILMIGPTGCGKTEIARRLAKLVEAPFIKVEATKYTEVGFVGRDVEDIVKDLVENAMALTRQRLKEKVSKEAAAKAEDRILRALVGPHADDATVEPFREHYRQGRLDDNKVDESEVTGGAKMEMGPFALMEKMMSPTKGPGSRNNRGEKHQITVREARQQLLESECERHLNSELVAKEALRLAEQDGIVFIDEIDKVVDNGRRYVSGNVSAEGVQRDLLPIIEGSVVTTKYGNVITDHILFICSGAFHSCKPSDMLAELQGRLPIRVELKGLTAADFYRILTEPENNMIRQQQLLLATEGVDLHFTEGAIRAVARVAEQANKLLDNIGARRLHTVLERVLADISFDAPDKVVEARDNSQADRYTYVVDQEHVESCMAPLMKKQDLSKYVL